MSSIIVCKTRLLTPEQAQTALRRGTDVNPVNAAGDTPAFREMSHDHGGRRSGGRRLALLTKRRWPASGVDLTVQFLDNPSPELRKRLLSHMNAWGEFANVLFRETSDIGIVRVSRVNRPPDDAGFWSYIGTEILGIEPELATMNLQGFTMRTSEAEFRRVVRHEAGHTLGFEHEHMRSDLVGRINRKKAIAYYRKSDNWSPAEVDEQVLTPLSSRSLTATTESDPTSIMCYQIPAEVTKDGVEIPGGKDINPKDHVFAASVYPKDGTGRGLIARRDPVPAAPGLAELTALTAIGAPTALAAYWRTAQADDALQILVIDAFDMKTGKIGTKPGESVFALVLASYGGARVTHCMQLKATPALGPTRYGNIIGKHKRIKAYTERESGTLPNDAEMLEFGADLFDTLFQGDVRRLYDEARSRQQGRKLELVLTSMISWIAEKPWEFAYDRTRRSFLATEEVVFVRNALAAVPAERVPPQRGPLSILVASAQPVGFGHLSVDQESAVIGRGFDQLVRAGLAVVQTMPRATPGSLLSKLSTERFDVVHFIGHGAFDEATGVGSLVFEDSDGGSLLVPERSLREIFCGRGIKLVFLNSCQSGSGGRADFNKGVAQALVSRGLPAVVANQYPVLDSSATSFAQHFYWALAQGMAIGQAARESRIAVNSSMQGDPIDWAVPVVYARDPSMVLCEQPQTPTQSPAAAGGMPRRQRSRTAVRIGVWDIDSVLPGLKATLRRLNESQDVFDFELMDLSAPLDIWDVEERAPDDSPYLWAERLAARLGPSLMGHGVRMLACITRHWLRGNEWLNLYGWVSPDRTPPVAVMSFAGFDDLPVEGARMDRALANVLVTLLAGFVCNLTLHAKGDHACPMWENSDRDLEQIIGTQRFDAACRRKLAKDHARELEAFDALLSAFD